MRHLLATLCTIILLGTFACSNDGPVAPGETAPTVPPAGTNPGGGSYQLLVTIDQTKTSGSAPLPVNLEANIIGGTAPYIFRWDVEGDATSFYLAKRLARSGLKISRIAYGLPAGSGLEYADELTLSRALEGRREMT